jgi:hypothetical protein
VPVQQRHVVLAKLDGLQCREYSSQSQVETGADRPSRDVDDLILTMELEWKILCFTWLAVEEAKRFPDLQSYPNLEGRAYMSLNKWEHGADETFLRLQCP